MRASRVLVLLACCVLLLGASTPSPLQQTLGCAGVSLLNTNYTPINITANTKIIAGTAKTTTWICHISLVVGAADNVALVEGTGTTCGTGTAGMDGGATAATGPNLAANGGYIAGDGYHVIRATATQGDDVCLFVSAGAQVSGTVVWVAF